ncbi:MAG: aldo/keto reductase [Pseudomonadota bacterium]
MKSVYLGRTGVEVSELCFGTMSFGGDADEAESARLYAACREAGITFFDCANIYAGGRSEEILGGLIAGHRDEIVLTTKLGHTARPGPNGKGASRRHAMAEIETSLKRLGTDHVDVLFLHKFDPMTPLEEQLRMMEDILRSGKALYLGASNFAAWQYAKALGIADRQGWQRIDVIQPMYSLVKRQAEVEILPMAEAEGLAVTNYSPIGAGLLSGKYAPGKRPEQGRLVSGNYYGVRYGQEWMYETAKQFTLLAQDVGIHPVSLAVAWTAAHPAITTPILGARNVAQLKPALESVEIEVTQELYERLAALSPAPPPPTDRLEEQPELPKIIQS